MSRFFPILALLIAVLIIFMYVKPTFSGPIKEIRAQISSYDDALAAADRFQQKQVELTQSRAQIPSDSLERLNEFLPDGVDNVQLILDMDALAARSGITLSDFDIQSVGGGAETASPTQPAGAESLGLETGSPVDSLNLTFKATGTYTAFRTFITGLESSLRPIDIVDLQVTQSETSVYSYSVTVRIYWLR